MAPTIMSKMSGRRRIPVRAPLTEGTLGIQGDERAIKRVPVTVHLPGETVTHRAMCWDAAGRACLGRRRRRPTPQRQRHERHHR